MRRPKIRVTTDFLSETMPESIQWTKIFKKPNDRRKKIKKKQNFLYHKDSFKKMRGEKDVDLF